MWSEASAGFVALAASCPKEAGLFLPLLRLASSLARYRLYGSLRVHVLGPNILRSIDLTRGLFKNQLKVPPGLGGEEFSTDAFL